ncbi:MAG: hypothetical protein SGJ26_15735 [Nitrospirota bacterium]|nr:hypothetical protein [Nitrospirota bacterium]
MDLFDKARKDMEAEVKASFKWVVLAAVFGLVVLLAYVMVVMAYADPSDIAVRIFSIDEQVFLLRAI